jgi:hypothetical protein
MDGDSTKTPWAKEHKSFVELMEARMKPLKLGDSTKFDKSVFNNLLN